MQRSVGVKRDGCIDSNDSAAADAVTDDGSNDRSTSAARATAAAVIGNVYSSIPVFLVPPGDDVLLLRPLWHNSLTIQKHLQKKRFDCKIKYAMPAGGHPRVWVAFEARTLRITRKRLVTV